MDAVVRFRAAVCLLGRFPALAGVDLDVAAGEIVLLQGPNGAGKTTLLRACAGLVPVVEGEAEVLGVDLRADRRPVRPLVGLLGHATGLYDDLTVAENVRFWSRAGRSHRADADAALDHAGRDLIDSLMVDAVSAGATVLCASHELDRAQAVAHRSVTVAGGTVAGRTHTGHNDEVPVA